MVTVLWLRWPAQIYRTASRDQCRLCSSHHPSHRPLVWRTWSLRTSAGDILTRYLFQLSLSKHRPPTPFHRQNKANKAVRYGNIFIFCSHYYRSKAIRRAREGGARAVDLPAKSFDLGRHGVAPPLLTDNRHYILITFHLLFFRLFLLRTLQIKWTF